MVSAYTPNARLNPCSPFRTKSNHCEATSSATPPSPQAPAKDAQRLANRRFRVVLGAHFDGVRVSQGVELESRRSVELDELRMNVPGRLDGVQDEDFSHLQR